MRGVRSRSFTKGSSRYKSHKVCLSGGADAPPGLGTKDHQHPPILPATHRKDLLACPLSQEEAGGLKHWQACNTVCANMWESFMAMKGG